MRNSLEDSSRCYSKFDTFDKTEQNPGDTEDKGYCSDIEDNNELESPHVIDSATVEKPRLPHVPYRRSLGFHKSIDNIRERMTKSLKISRNSGVNALHSPAYDADAELSEQDPPSMGNREDWDRTRLERNKRYIEAINDEE